MRLTLLIGLVTLGTLSLHAQTPPQAPSTAYERGATVLLVQEGVPMAPKILAVPGDTVRVGADGVFVNNVSVPTLWQIQGSWPQSVVPQGHYFVIAESKSGDSTTRFWGLIPATRITGKPQL